MDIYFQRKKFINFYIIINKVIIVTNLTFLCTLYRKFLLNFFFLCSSSTLQETLAKMDIDSLQRFTPGDPSKFGDFMDKLVGFS